MGYSADLVDGGDLTVPASQVPALRAALAGMHVSWIGSIEDDNDPAEVYAEYGFDVTEGDDGSFTIWGWSQSRMPKMVRGERLDRRTASRVIHWRTHTCDQMEGAAVVFARPSGIDVRRQSEGRRSDE